MTVAGTAPGPAAERVVPIVLDAYGVGSSRYQSELVLANRGTSPATVELTYTAATALNASGTGTVTETLGAGRQLVLDDVLAWLRSRGLAIPPAAPGASQGGSLRVRFGGLSSSDAAAAFARTTALLPQGRAGVAYPGVDPADWQAASGLHVFGLRETADARSNLALVNLSSTTDVSLRVTLYSGTSGDRRTFVLPETIFRAPLQWTQFGSVLHAAGSRTAGPSWSASGDGPVLLLRRLQRQRHERRLVHRPDPGRRRRAVADVPVVLELGIYSSELILANPPAATPGSTSQYVESLAAAGEARLPSRGTLLPSRAEDRRGPPPPPGPRGRRRPRNGVARGLARRQLPVDGSR